MCVVSMIMDHHLEKWKLPYTYPLQPPLGPFIHPRIPTQAEIDEFYKLLERARKYDAENNQPDCELESKKQQLLDLAKQLGITIIIP